MVNVLAARPSSRLLKKPCGTANPSCAWKIKAIDSALVPEIVRHNLLGIDFFSSLLELRNSKHYQGNAHKETHPHHMERPCWPTIFGSRSSILPYMGLPPN